MFRNNLGSTLIAYDTNSLVLTSPQKDIFRIPIKGRLEVHYRNEKLPGRIYQDIAYPVSWITFTKNYVLVNKEGAPINSSDIIIEGAMSTDRVAHLLPLDYQPFSQLVKVVENYQQIMEPFYEKIYIHSDKGYYYPGETLWFKGYINYREPSLRDSLSRSIYVDFIHGETGKVMLSKTLLIDSGMFRGDFALPDTLKSSDYYMRAYTNLNRNFGDDNLYKKQIPILNFFERPELAGGQEVMQSELKIISDKTSYTTHEKITLAIQILDEDGNPMAADLSISVTDASKVVSLPGTNILSDFTIREIPEAKSFKHPAEYGIGFRAKLKDEHGKPAKGNINILQINPKGFYMALTDDKSIFSLINLFFYDTSQFSFQIIKGKKQVFGSAELLEREAPRFSYQPATRPFKIVQTQSPQSQQSTADIPKGARLLKEVVVKSTKIYDPVNERPYGKSDYVLKLTDLNTSYGNLLMTLPGKVPGLIVRQAEIPGEGLRWVVYIQRAATSSINLSREVTVLINNVVMGGTPGDILGSINPNSIASIEVTNRINPLLGGLGCCGLINIFTKANYSESAKQDDITFLKIPGYSKPRNFTGPDYEKTNANAIDEDKRALLYWNPNVIINDKSVKATVSFFASDNRGQYRAIVEGVTTEGKPVHGEYLINVNH